MLRIPITQRNRTESQDSMWLPFFDDTMVESRVLFLMLPNVAGNTIEDVAECCRQHNIAKLQCSMDEILIVSLAIR